MREIVLARKLEAKYRKLRRFVESPAFQHAFLWCYDQKYPVDLIMRGKLNLLKDWTYRQNPLVDAPQRWLRVQARKHNIKNYSRKTKVELVNELSGIIKNAVNDNDSNTKSGRYTKTPT